MTDEPADRSVADTLRHHVQRHRYGILFDLVFAIAWVTVVSLVFGLLGAPRLVTYLAMAAGVVAYYGFVWSLDATRRR